MLTVLTKGPLFLSRHYVYVTHTAPIKSFDFNRRTGEIFWTCPTMNMIGRHARADRDSLKLPNTTVWLSDVDRLDFILHKSSRLQYIFCWFYFV